MKSQHTKPTKTNGNSQVVHATLARVKTKLLQEHVQDAAFLTLCYQNWFDRNINASNKVKLSLRKDNCYQNWFDRNINAELQLVNAKDISPKVRANFEITAQGWKRARDLFFALALAQLPDIAHTVAAEIEREYGKRHPNGAKDIADNLRNTSLLDILNHKE